MSPRCIPQERHLIWLDFTPQAGHKQAGRRPALVVSPVAYNAVAGLALVCPITSASKGYPFEVALPYGPSSAAPDDDVRAFELYFERLDRAGLGSLKRPDLLVFPSSERSSVEAAVGQVGGVGDLPFTPEDASAIQALLARSVVAVECENSLWKCRQMPDFGADLRPQRGPDAPPPSPETPPTYRPFSVPGRRKPHPQHPEHAKPGRRSAAGARRGRVRSEPTAR